jgi:hypothetical protein
LSILLYKIRECVSRMCTFLHEICVICLNSCTVLYSILKYPPFYNWCTSIYLRDWTINILLKHFSYLDCNRFSCSQVNTPFFHSQTLLPQ